MNKRLDLKTPQGFNEKLQWLKLHDRKPVYTTMVDKYAAKKYVADIIGKKYIIPTLGVWEHFDEIDFDALPEQFVLKCTHDSESVIICRDKKSLDKGAARDKLERLLKKNYFWGSREWPYKGVPPRILAERYMEDTGTAGAKARQMTDYKFYCFHGEPEFLYVSEGLEDHGTARISFLNMDWSFAPFGRTDYKPFENLPDKPQNFAEMVRLAKKLSDGIPFVRVDFYEVLGQVYFGELTFYPCSGFMPFCPPEWDDRLGERIDLKRL